MKANWGIDEEILLLQLVKDRKGLVTHRKSSPNITIEEKRQAWFEIAMNLNDAFPMAQRTPVQVERKWLNLLHLGKKSLQAARTAAKEDKSAATPLTTSQDIPKEDKSAAMPVITSQDIPKEDKSAAMPVTTSQDLSKAHNDHEVLTALTAATGSMKLSCAAEHDQKENDQLRPERVFRDHLNPLDVSDDYLLQHCQLPRHEILQLCEEFGPYITRNPNKSSHRALPVHTQIMIALHFFASGTLQNIVSDAVGLGSSSVLKVINDVTNALFSKAVREIRMPQDPLEVMQTKQDFHSISGFPSVIGAMDCTHIPIKAPRNPVPYLNKKRRYTLNIQVVADSTMKIISFCARFPGSVHDCYIWSRSVLRQQCLEGQFEDSLLLGDSGYPLETFLMTPVSEPTTAAEHAYNRSHAKTRAVIERTFRTLKSRFRCLRESDHSLQFYPEKGAQITIACMLLHNICIQKKIPLDLPLLDNDDPGADAYTGDNQTGQARQRSLIDNVFS